MTKEKDRFEELLVESFYVAIDAADPHKVVPPHIPSTFQGDVVVVGAGKAAASMAAAVEQAWPEKDLTGVVITRHGHSEETHKIQVLEASHPIPDKSNLEATQKMMDQLDHLKEGSLLLALISGGGSSLLSLPVEGVTIEDIRKVTEDLLKSGTSIDHINAVRKHVSQVKGGQLALAARAKGAEVLSLIISGHRRRQSLRYRLRTMCRRLLHLCRCSVVSEPGACRSSSLDFESPAQRCSRHYSRDS